MYRQTRTAPELEQMILALARASCECPPDLKLKVIRVDGRWDAFPEIIDKQAHPECLAAVVRIAAALRAEYDLAD
jgi:hypothetical protein